ncbi:MAG: hypothetical protein K2K18_01910, partial [Malacoplasma sp.]|nr:hypothetical protein [Malacoplasma sp.]
MKNKFFKLLLSGFAITFGTLTMSSCASSATNLFGIYAEATSNYNDTTTVTEKKDGTETSVSAGYSGIFGGFKFNNFGFSSNSPLLPSKQDDASNNPNSLTYSAHAWQDFIFPLLSYTVSLSDLYNMGFSDKTINLKETPIISSSDDSLLEQFIYSWANVLSKGKESIRFGITSIRTKVKESSKSFFPQVSSTTSTDTTQQNDNKLTWTWDDEEKKETGMYTFTSTNTFQIGFEFGYWNAANDNPDQGQSNIEDVKNMINKTGSWSSAKNFNVEQIKQNMWLILNFDFSLTLSYSENQVVENLQDSDKQNENKENSHQDITWTEELKNKNISPIFSFNNKDKNIDIKTTSQSIQ